MKTNKLYFKILLLGVFCFVSACGLLDQDDNTYDGPPTIAFEFSSDVVDAGAGQVGANIQVITANGRNDDLSVNFSVVADETTAEAGSDYSIVSSSPLMIESGSYENTLVIDVDGSDIPPDEARVLTIQLQDTDGVEVAGNSDLNTYTLTIRGTED